MAITIADFSKGWQNIAQHEQGISTSVFMAKDAEFSRLGAIRARECLSYHEYFDPKNTAPMSSSIRSIFQFEKEGPVLVTYWISSSTHLFRYRENPLNVSWLKQDLDANKKMSYAAIRPVLSGTTYVYMTNGTFMACDSITLTDALGAGTALYEWGIDYPRNSLDTSLLSGSGNHGAGVYKYAYTFYDPDSGAESNPSPVSGNITTSSGDGVLVGNIQISSNPRVTQRRLYRTLQDGGTLYRCLTITNNTQTSIVDSISDDDLGTELVTDQGAPPTGDVVFNFRDRLFLGGDPNYQNRVWYSRALRPDNFPSNYYFDCGGAQNKVRSFGEFSNKFYIFLTGGIWVLHGTSQSEFEYVQTPAHTGILGRWTVATGKDGIYFLGHDGIYRFNGVQCDKVSLPIDRIFNFTAETWTDIIDIGTAEEASSGGFDGTNYCITVPMKDTDGTIQRTLLIYDTETQTWTSRNRAVWEVFEDTAKERVMASVEVDDDTYDGYYQIGYLSGQDYFDYDKPEVDVVTHSFDVRIPTETVLSGQNVEQRVREGIGWVKKYRFDGSGSWTLYFYLDDRLIETVTLGNQSRATANVWHDFPPASKGRYLYVRCVSYGTAKPSTHEIRGIYVK